MSAVDDVEHRLCRLEEALTLKRTALLELSTSRAFSPTRGVDKDRRNRSVACLELGVHAAEHVQAHNGFFSGRGLYIRATLDPSHATHEPQVHRTTTAALSSSPSWHQQLVFEGITMVHAALVLELIQEERFGADSVLGGVILDLGALHDQRVHENWHGLVGRDRAPLPTRVHVRCRLDRSRLSALELECELLQNQIRELREFVARSHRQPTSPSLVMPPRYLEGKEIHLPPATTSLARKRERRRSSTVATGGFPLGLASPTMASMTMTTMTTTLPNHSTVPLGFAVPNEEPRAKRRKLENGQREAPVDGESFSTRLANWLLPGAPTPSSSTADVGGGGGAFAIGTSHPPPLRPSVARRKKSKFGFTAALEDWLFPSDATAGAPTAAAATSRLELIHAQMHAER